MSLQFTSLNDLKTDLESKDGIYAVDKIVNSFDDLDEFTRHDLAVITKQVDGDGTERYVVKTQQIVEELADNSFGYGANRQWDLKDDSAQTFEDELTAHAKSFEGSSHGGSTIIRVVVNDSNPKFNSGVATAYKEDGSTVTALLYKDDTENWQTQILSG